MAHLTINTHPVEVRMDSDIPLLFALREAAGLTGTKYGCGNGDCGACTVIIDGEATKSCLLPLGECEGRSVTTIEGLATEGAPEAPRGPSGRHPVQVALLEAQAVQCGFCTPGIVMAATALLRRNADPSEAEIKAAITNMCRCGVYPRLVRAVQEAGAALRAASMPVIPAAPRHAATNVAVPLPEPPDASPSAQASLTP